MGSVAQDWAVIACCLLRLADQVDDNDYKFDQGQGGSLVAGENFGSGTNIVTGPDGDLYVTSLSNGAVYRIASK